MKSLFLLALACVGCAGLSPKLIDSSVQKPSNVALYFTVDTNRGEPVPGLTADAFRIYEDDKLVSPFESKQTILNPEVAAMHYTLLLVDMSGSVRQSGQLPALAEATSRFTQRVGQYQQTAVYAFDGRADIVPIRGFSSSSASTTVGSLSSFHSTDPSTNLNGAVVAAVNVLEKQMEKSPVPLRFGTLVVFTDGTDHASRVSHSELMRVLDDVDFDVFVIGIGAEIDEAELGAIGRSSAALSKNPEQVGAAFDQIAARIEGFSKRFYLLSYCSPARAGKHVLRVEPFTHKGQAGSLSFDFDATGFGPQCDPNKKPAFDIRRPRIKPNGRSEPRT